MPAGDFESIREPEGDEKRARLGDWARLGNGLFHLRRMAGFGPPGLYDLLRPHVTKVVVCDPRKNVLLKRDNQCDRSDARKLTELLPAGLLSAVYHGRTRLQAFRQLRRSYLAISKDLTSTMDRLKALYRSRSIPWPSAYAPRHRAGWLSRITRASVRRRAELWYQQRAAGVAQEARHIGTASTPRRTCSRTFRIWVRFGRLG